MKKIWRILAFLTVLCLLTGALLACGDSGEGEDTTAANTNGDTTEGETTEAGDPAYLFTVVYEDTNQPAEGVQVQLCVTDGDLCLMPIASDANGKVNYNQLGTIGYGIYDVHILEDSIPEGYTFDNSALKTSADVHEYTLVLKKKCEHSFVNEICTKCGAAQTYPHTVQAKYADDIADLEKRGTPIAGLALMITSDTQIIAQGSTNQDGIFAFEAPKYVSDNEITGYTVVVTDGAPDGYKLPEDPTFLVNSDTCVLAYEDISVAELYTAFNPLKIKIGKTAHLTLPEARYDDGDSLFSTAHDDSLYYFSVKPSKPEDVGFYRLTVTNISNGATVYVGHYPSTVATVSPKASVSATGNDNPSFTFMMQEQYLKDSTGAWTYSNSWLFGIRAEGEAEYPIELDVTVERVRDLIPGEDYAIADRVTVEMVAGAEKADNVVGSVSDKKLNKIKLVKDENGAFRIGTADGMEAVLVKGNDGYYRVGSANGPIAMIVLTQNNPIFGEEGAAFTTVNSLSGVENLLVSAQVTENGKRYNRVSYYSAMISQYAELTNADGAYPLNQQLYDFITAWTAQRASGIVVDGYGEYGYMLALSYYTDK